MIKRFKIENLDCGNCARKLEEEINKLDGVIECKVNFLTQRVTLNIEDDKYDELIVTICNLAKKVSHSTIVVI